MSKFSHETIRSLCSYPVSQVLKPLQPMRSLCVFPPKELEVTVAIPIVTNVQSLQSQSEVNFTLVFN